LKNVRFALFLLAVFGCGHALNAQETSATRGKVPLTPEAAINTHFLTDLQLSPDGTHLAFVVSEAPKGEQRAQHIWMYDKRTDAVRQFTYSKKSETSPRWSPDGSQLAFLSNRGGDEQQIYLMSGSGGEAAARTKGKSNIKSFEWSKDSKYIAYMAPDAKTEEDEKKEKDKNDARVADKDNKQPRVWLLPVESGDPKAITPANWEVKELAWMPSSQNLVVSATDHPESDQNTDRIFGVHVPDGQMIRLAAPRGPFGQIRVSPNGKTIAYIGPREDGPSPHDLMLLPVENDAARNVSGLSLDRQIFDFKWLRDGTLLGISADGFHTKFTAFGANGAIRQINSTIPINPSAFAASDNGEAFFVSQTATQPQELFVWDQKTNPRQITHINDAWKQYSLATPEFYKYKSFDGQEIEAALLKPAATTIKRSCRLSP